MDTQPTTPSLPEIRAAANLLVAHIIRTPLLRLNAAPAAGEIYLKLENLQLIGAYKVRSMGHILLSADPYDLRNGVYTASSGNAGLGLAWMAQKMDIAARVYAPESSPTAKLDAIRKYGAQVHVLSHEEWWQIIETSGHATDPGLYVDAVRAPAALAGNATMGLEIIEQLADVDRIIAPFGGGGLVCGIAAAVRALKPGTDIIVAESDAAAPATAAFAAGRPVEIDVHPSFISGAGAPCVLKEMWPLVSQLVDSTLVVTVREVAAAIRLMCVQNHVIAEGAGAIAVAAALANPQADGKTVCIVSGGNIGLDVMSKILQQQL